MSEKNGSLQEVRGPVNIPQTPVIIPNNEASNTTVHEIEDLNNAIPNQGNIHEVNEFNHTTPQDGIQEVNEFNHTTPQDGIQEVNEFNHTTPHDGIQEVNEFNHTTPQDGIQEVNEFNHTTPQDAQSELGQQHSIISDNPGNLIHEAQLSSKGLLDLYNKHIIEYYNLSLIKKLIGSKVAFSDFNDKSYQFLLHHNNDSTDLNEKLNDYQNDLLIQVFQELFLIQSVNSNSISKNNSELSLNKSQLPENVKGNGMSAMGQQNSELFMKYIYFISDEIKKHQLFLVN